MDGGKVNPCLRRERAARTQDPLPTCRRCSGCRKSSCLRASRPPACERLASSANGRVSDATSTSSVAAAPTATCTLSSPGWCASPRPPAGGATSSFAMWLEVISSASSRRSMAAAVCWTPSRCANRSLRHCRPEAFRAILANHTSVRERLLRRLSGLVRELTARVLELGARRVQSRVLAELVRLGHAAGATGKAVRIERAPTHKEIASRVGTSREEVTRELSRLSRRGLLQREGRNLLLRDLPALEALVADVPREELPRPESLDEWRVLGGAGPRRQRRAILVADALDATRLMERDEQRTLERWRSFFAHASAEVIPTLAGRSFSRPLPAMAFSPNFPTRATPYAAPSSCTRIWRSRTPQPAGRLSRCALAFMSPK